MSDEQLPQVEPDVEAEAESLELDQIPPEQRAKDDEPPMANRVLHRILTGNALISVLAVLVAFVIGGILIAITDPGVQAAAGYFFARPGDTFRAIGEAIGGAFSALFQGAIYNFRRPGIRQRDQTADGDADLRHPTHRCRAGGRAGVPRRHVQHRWSRPDPHRGRGRRMGRLVVRAAVLRTHAGRGAGRHGGRRTVGGDRRPAQGAHGSARGDRHHHAELRGVLSDRLPASDARGAAGRPHEQPESHRPPIRTPSCRRCRICSASAHSG